MLSPAVVHPHPNFTVFLVGLSSQIFCSLRISASLLCHCPGCMIVSGSPRILGPVFPFTAWDWHQVFWYAGGGLHTCCRSFHALLAFSFATWTGWRLMAPLAFWWQSLWLGFGFCFSLALCFRLFSAATCFGFQSFKCCLFNVLSRAASWSGNAAEVFSFSTAEFSWATWPSPAEVFGFCTSTATLCFGFSTSTAGGFGADSWGRVSANWLACCWAGCWACCWLFPPKFPAIWPHIYIILCIIACQQSWGLNWYTCRLKIGRWCLWCGHLSVLGNGLVTFAQGNCITLQESAERRRRPLQWCFFQVSLRQFLRIIRVYLQERYSWSYRSSSKFHLQVAKYLMNHIRFW